MCGVGGEWVGHGRGSGGVGWGGVNSVRVVSPDYLCRLTVQVSVYCVWRIPAHPMCTIC